MSAAFVLTKDVKHVATWTQDREADGSWRTGSYRPICGGKVRDWRHTFHLDIDYEDERFIARAERLPVCRYCLRAVAEINAAIGRCVVTDPNPAQRTDWFSQQYEAWLPSDPDERAEHLAQVAHEREHGPAAGEETQ